MNIETREALALIRTQMIDRIKVASAKRERVIDELSALDSEIEEFQRRLDAIEHDLRAER